MTPHARRLLLELGALVGAGSLVAMLGLQSFVFAPLASFGASLFVFVVQATPLMVVTPVLIARRPRAAFWMTLVSLLYFVHGVALAATSATRVVGAFEIAFALVLFGASVTLLRIEQRG